MRHRISKANSMFYAKKALFCDPKLPAKKRIEAFYSTCVPAAVHGAGEWAYTQSMFQALRIWELGKLRRVLCLRRRPIKGWVDYMKRTGVIAARQLKKHSQQRVQTLAMRRVRIAAWQMVSSRDNKVVINWMNGAWEVKGEEHAIPVRGVVNQFVRWFLGGTFRPRTDEND